ncbi:MULTISPECIES: hypothetical protein [Aequorivita]|uniref:Uncharacterized protein n=1 Tax=Aequorivita iocasae TaxID=2803865 RepID=A0ABX7DPF8_9FLAO|nr:MULTISPECIES: hypothetical protein [Aequorivita]QQX75973.1 hypothetical protein JK629_11595 [Aequorivita iocasae]UCA55434.1 hypothetical protein LDL78_11650 [Aequorivita sp. F7]
MPRAICSASIPWRKSKDNTFFNSEKEMGNIVEIFQTNISNFKDAAKITSTIQGHFPFYDTNFDLEDSDNILRIEAAEPIDASGICELLSKAGFKGTLLT